MKILGKALLIDSKLILIQHIILDWKWSEFYRNSRLS